MTSHAEGEFEDITFDVHEGEILGLFGYLGAGMTEIARALFGTLKTNTGSITLDDTVSSRKIRRQAKKLGLAYLSENRRATIFPKT